MSVFTVNSVVCCVLLLVVTAQCLAITPFQLWKEHKNRTQNFRCGVPKPMSFKASDLFSDLPDSIDPVETVLHRCGATTGCCDNKYEECGMITEEDVKLVFFQVTTGQYFEYQQKNHTECGCQPKKNSIK